MDLHVTLEGVGDRAERIYRQLRLAILDGRIRPGEQLPPSRELAAELAVSRNTVLSAYERLLAEGYTIARAGAGTFVAESVRGGTASRAARRGILRPRPGWRSLPTIAEPQYGRFAYDFGPGTPDASLFPLARWRSFVNAELSSPRAITSRYGDPRGHAGLRAAIARHLGVSRAVQAGPDDVLITNGAQHAIELVCRVLVSRGTVVAVEDPGYPPVRSLFRSFGAEVVTVPVDDEGIVVDAIPAEAAIVYSTPSHQFPTGVVLSRQRRADLLSWAHSHNAAIIEDDYDSEYRFADRPLEPLQSLDRVGRVIYVGTFSKTLLPGLRTGFLIAPGALQPALQSARALGDWHGDLTTQGALAGLIESGQFAAHLRRSRRTYALRRTTILERLDALLGDVFAVKPSSAGIHLCGTFAAGPGALADRVREAAAVRGVGVQTLGHFSAEPTSVQGLVIGFGSISTEQIDDGIRELAAVVRREL